MRRMRQWRGVSGRFALVAAAAGLVVFPAISSAALVAYEGFDYVVGTKVNTSTTNSNVNGGSGWSDSWSSYNPDPSRSAAGSLSAGALTTTGNHFTTPTTSNQNGNGATRHLTTTAAAAFNSGGNLTGVSRWISLLLRPETGTTDNFTLSLGNTGGGGYAGPQKIYTSGGYYGFNGTSGFVSSGVAWAANQTVFLVLKIDFTDATHWNGTLYVDPTPGLVSPDVTGTSHALKELKATTSLSQGGNGWSVDELRFGETYQDVSPVPEPTTISLLGIGGLALLRRRRRMG